MVIDVLNMRNQMEYQKTTWGKYNEQINNCIVRGLQEIMETEEGESLLALIDPYSYHSLLTMPKLSVIDTNDPYWFLDALNIYWNNFLGPITCFMDLILGTVWTIRNKLPMTGQDFIVILLQASHHLN